MGEVDETRNQVVIPESPEITRIRADLIAGKRLIATEEWVWQARLDYISTYMKLHNSVREIENERGGKYQGNG